MRLRIVTADSLVAPERLLAYIRATMAADVLSQLFEAKRHHLEAEAAVLDGDDEAALAKALAKAVKAAQEHPDRTESSFRLQVLAELLGKVGDRAATRELLRVLDHGEDSVRAVAFDELERLARRGRLAEVLWAVEQALGAESAELKPDDAPTFGLSGEAASLLPALLLTAASDDEAPPPLDLLVQLADHEDPNTCVEALCALAEFDGAGVSALISSFADDERSVSGADGSPKTVGHFALQLLSVRDMQTAIEKQGYAGGGSDNDAAPS